MSSFCIGKVGVFCFFVFFSASQDYDEFEVKVGASRLL